ncbi:hypothetical protein [Mesorhizobium sp. M0051]
MGKAVDIMLNNIENPIPINDIAEMGLDCRSGGFGAYSLAM